MSPIHPFDAIRSAEEAWTYLQGLLPAGKPGDGFQHDSLSPAYARAIAAHYAEHTIKTPACTVANVVATILSPEVWAVLRMVRSQPESALVAQELLLMQDQGAKSILGGVAYTLQEPLRRVVPGAVATQTVGAYLAEFTG